MIVYTYCDAWQVSKKRETWVPIVVMFTVAGFVISFFIDFIYQFFIMFAIINRLHITACKIITVRIIAILSASLLGPIFSPKALAHNLHIPFFISFLACSLGYVLEE